MTGFLGQALLYIVPFLLVLTYRAFQELGTDDTDEMRLAEPKNEPLPPTGTARDWATLDLSDEPMAPQLTPPGPPGRPS